MSTRAYSKEFVPRVDLGGLCLLWNGQSFIEDGNFGVFEVVALQGGPLWGQHGAIVVWTQAAAAPAGYALDSSALSGSIAAAGSSPTLLGPSQAINSLKGPSKSWEVIQARFLAKSFGTITASTTVSDIDVVLSNPTSSPFFSLKNVLGVINASGQVQLPGDVTVLPLSDANIALPSVAAGLDAFENGAAVRSEQYILGDGAPSVSLYNTNATTAITGTTQGLALVVAGYRFRLHALKNYSSKPETILNATVNVPTFMSTPDLRNLPILQIGSAF
jgi:hypothetical protein